ncbi:MAG: phosphotransferase [Ilumatobacteraceae bacterium]
MTASDMPEVVARMGFVAEPSSMHALTGGVSSDIWRVELGDRSIVVKRALAQLRVAGEWRAPLARTGAEVAWMRIAAGVRPGLTPEVLAVDRVDDTIRAFAMPYLDPTDHPLWKAELRDGRADPCFAGEVGTAVAAIHAATANRDAVRSEFDDVAMFAALRLDPYLGTTAVAHPDRADVLNGLRATYLANRRVLVHGDVSPKNILVGPGGPVLLDAECATWGDPAFDPAFCCTHLLLKCRWNPGAAEALLDCALRFGDAYCRGVTWEQPSALEARCVHLVAGLLLARVDGLSPVEYLRDDDRVAVRATARALLVEPPDTVVGLVGAWRDSLPASPR